MKIIWWSFLGIALMKILVKEHFPNIEIHDNEKQNFVLSDYFFGDSLTYEVEGAPPYMKFGGNRKVCSVHFDNPGLFAFLLDPPDEDSLQRLIILHHNYTLVMYEMDNVCFPQIKTIDIQEKLKGRGYNIINSTLK